MFMGWYDKGDTEISIVDEQKDRFGNLVHPAKILKTDAPAPQAEDDNNRRAGVPNQRRNGAANRSLDES